MFWRVREGVEREGPGREFVQDVFGSRCRALGVGVSELEHMIGFLRHRMVPQRADECESSRQGTISFISGEGSQRERGTGGTEMERSVNDDTRLALLYSVRRRSHLAAR